MLFSCWKLHRQLLREVRAHAVGDAVGEPLAGVLIEVEDVLPARRQRGGVAAPVFEHLLRLPALQVHQVDVVVGLIPGDFLPVGQVAQPERVRRFVCHVDRGQIRRGELHELPVGERDDRTVVARALLLGAHLLHRLDDRVVRRPEVHLDRRAASSRPDRRAAAGEVRWRARSRAPSFEKRGAALSATTIPVGMPAVDAETSSVAAASGRLPVVETVRRRPACAYSALSLRNATC